MDVGDIFSGSSLKASDLQGRDVTVTVKGFEIKEFDDGKKLSLSFMESDKELICNKTNANTIAGLYGGAIEGWVGKRITLFPTQTDYAGQQVACIRVKLNPPPPEPQSSADIPGTAQLQRDPAESGEVPF